MAKIKLKKTAAKADTTAPAKQKPAKLSVARVREISDSLRKQSGLVGVGSPLSMLNKNSTPADSANAYKAGFARIEEAEKNKKESNRLRLLADAAVSKVKKK